MTRRASRSEVAAPHADAVSSSHRSLFETSWDGILILDVGSGAIVDANPHLVDLLGYSRGELLGQSVCEVGLFDDVAACRRALARLQQRGHVRHDDLVLRTRAGASVDVELVANTCEVDGVLVAQCNIRDITKRKHTEEILRERVKEMSCIASISETLARTDQPLEMLLETVVHQLPKGYRHPEQVVARISMDGHDYGGDARGQGINRRLARDIISDGHPVGVVAVSYCAEAPQPAGDAFLEEERQLLGLIALKIGQARAQRREQERFRQLLETAPDAMVITRASGEITLVNAQTERLFGYARTEMIGQPIEMLLPRRYRLAHRRHRHAYAAAPTLRGMGAGRELHARARDGREFPVEVSLGPLETSEGTLVSSTIRDISERKRAEAAVQRLSRMRAMSSAINATVARVRDRDELFHDACRIAVERGQFVLAWIGIADPAGELRPVACHGADDGYVSALRITLDADDPRGRGPSAVALREGKNYIVHDVVTDSSMEPWRDDALQRGYRGVASLPLRLDNDVIGVISLYTSEPGFFDDEEVALLEELASDVSFAMESIERRDRIEFLALHDALTRLANRTLFIERLGHAIQTARADKARLTVLVLDLERFKSVNDALGMATGDEMLRVVARRLATIAGGAEYVARLEGDRFAMFVPRVGEAAELSALVQEKLWRGLGAPLKLADVELHPAARVGIALYPDDGQDADTLFRNAESALKKAKSSGERYLFYTQEMHRAVRKRLGLESRVRRAVAQREMTLHYQPRVNLRNGRICGAEALLRWDAAEELRLSIPDVVRMLEETGSIAEAGHWVMQQTLADRKAWLEAGLTVPAIAVNVSVMQLQQFGFVDEIAALVEGMPADHPGLELELTESTLMQDVDANLAKLQRIRDLGVPIAIDDFGTGYSSLSYLSRLPISTLKIDRSFIMEMGSNAGAMSIVSAIVSLAHSMNLRVVAEGVETPDQLKFLRLLRCDEMQGFLFSPAVEPAAFAELLRTQPRLPLG